MCVVSEKMGKFEGNLSKTESAIRARYPDIPLINTARLLIVPLPVDVFGLLLKSVSRMENALGLIPSGEILEEHTQQAMQTLYRQAVERQDVFWWYTNWQIILKNQKLSIGSACFMSAPDESRAVEVGYGVNAAFRENGYMTEALAALSQWALQQPHVQRLIAETENSNQASHRVLQKVGYTQSRESENSLYWRLEDSTE